MSLISSSLVLGMCLVAFGLFDRFQKFLQLFLFLILLLFLFLFGLMLVLFGCIWLCWLLGFFVLFYVAFGC